MMRTTARAPRRIPPIVAPIINARERGCPSPGGGGPLKDDDPEEDMGSKLTGKSLEQTDTIVSS
jgi:hypothetical protein